MQKHSEYQLRPGRAPALLPHVGLEDAAAERCLVAGLPRIGLDSRLHPALGDVGGDGAAPAHGFVGVRPVHHGVLLLRAPIQAKNAVRAPHAKRKLLLHVSSASLLLVSSLFTSGLFRAAALYT